MTDEDIIQLFFERSEQAIAQLAAKHGGAVARVAGNILGNAQDTEECVNDTYLGAWHSIPPNKPSPLRTFVCKIARNLATKKYHANTAKKRNSQYDAALDELEEYISTGKSAEDEYCAKELAAAINSFLSTLNYSDRFLFTRRYWYSEPLKDIAEMSNSTQNSVAVRLCRIRERLKDYLIKEGEIV